MSFLSNLQILFNDCQTSTTDLCEDKKEDQLKYTYSIYYFFSTYILIISMQKSFCLLSLFMSQIGLLVLLIVAIISTQLWSRVSWFMQFSRLFVVSFFISIIWNWFYLYKVKSLFVPIIFLKDRKVCMCIYKYFFCQTAFADHQKHMAKLNGISEKCTGVKKIDWSDSLKGELPLHLNYISLPLQPNRSVQNINLKKNHI